MSFSRDMIITSVDDSSKHAEAALAGQSKQVRRGPGSSGLRGLPSDRTRTLPCSPSGNLVADTICRTAEIGLTITAAADAGTFTIIDAAPVAVEGHCPDCTQPEKLRDHTVRRLFDLPVVGFPTRLHVRAPLP